MQNINHENVLKLIEKFEDDNFIDLLMPHCEKGNLYELSKNL